MLPQHRDDTDAILTLKRDLDKTVPIDSTCSVMASSFVLNDSILRNVEASINAGETRSADYIIGLPEVDSRDYGRLWEIYNASYILVAVPAQTHLASGEQTIVDEGVSSFINNSDIAESFTLIENFTRTIGDMEVRLYQRTGEVSMYQRSMYESRLFY